MMRTLTRRPGTTAAPALDRVSRGAVMPLPSKAPTCITTIITATRQTSTTTLARASFMALQAQRRIILPCTTMTPTSTAAIMQVNLMAMPDSRRITPTCTTTRGALPANLVRVSPDHPATTRRTTAACMTTIASRNPSGLALASHRSQMSHGTASPSAAATTAASPLPLQLRKLHSQLGSACGPTIQSRREG